MSDISSHEFTIVDEQGLTSGNIHSEVLPSSAWSEATFLVELSANDSGDEITVHFETDRYCHYDNQIPTNNDYADIDTVTLTSSGKQIVEITGVMAMLRIFVNTTITNSIDVTITAQME